MKITLILNLAGEESTASCSSEDVEVHPMPYGIDLSSYEWQLTIRFSGGQDMKTRICVVLAEIDGGMSVLQATVADDQVADQVASMVSEITSAWVNKLEIVVK